MARDSNDTKTKQLDETIIGTAEIEATQPLWRVNYTFVSPNAQLRTGSLVVAAPDEAVARIKAIQLLTDNAKTAFWKITAVRKY